ncbi:MAG TPA: DnaJ domain-containing protein [Clostridiaceae bacterium]|nr:DnaJ domain-containing protein [Clostridiaceae bacterium]
MEHKKDPYEILGVKKGDSESEIERKYFILSKRYKIEKSENPEADIETKIEELNWAYNVLMGGSTEKSEEEEINESSPILRKLGINQKKLSNFFHYYKFHILISIIVIVFVGYTVKGCITRVDPDFCIAFVGDYSYTDTLPLKEMILNEWTDVKEILIDGAILSEDNDPQLNYAMQMKAVVLFGAGDVDVFILDKTNFEKYAKQGAFISLDEIVDELNIDLERNKDYILKVEVGEDEGTAGEHLYGIDVSGSRLFSDNVITGDEKIAAIYTRTKRYDLSVKFLKLLLN